MTKNAAYWINKLHLEKHPEGGWFKEVYRSVEVVPGKSLSEGFPRSRNFSTSIYYLLEGDDFSSFHRIKSDEIWHYYKGNSPIEIISIENGKIFRRLCGNQPDENQDFQLVVPKNTWFATRLSNSKGFALAGCTVSPGFPFADFELAGKELLEEFQKLLSEIKDLII